MKGRAALKRISDQCLNNLAARFSCHSEPFDKLPMNFGLRVKWHRLPADESIGHGQDARATPLLPKNFDKFIGPPGEAPASGGLRAGSAALLESAAALSEAQSANPNGKAQSRNLSLLAGRRAKFREQ
jgi:hypothetical protein